MLLNREAAVVFTTGGLSDSHERYNALKVLGRTRDSLVRDQTRLSNRIHSHVRILFPGFLDESRANPISPFSDACLNLMHKSDFTATRYARKKNTSLARTLKKLRLRNSQEKASQLIARARTALAPAPHMVQAHQDSLGCLVAGYLAVKQNAAQLERRQISHLAGTPGALLTSISGIGMITASALSGELGPPEQLGCRAQMASYSGIIPRTKQSGGPDSPSKILRVGHHCNHRLKNHVVRAATAIGQRFGPPELQEHWKELQEKGQHAAFIYARRLLSTSKAIMNNGTIWLPKSLRGGATAGEAGAREYRLQMFRYLQEMWPRLRSKWAAHQALESAFAPENPLGQWREVIVQLYRIELPLEELPVCLKEESELTPADH
jgi:transposase